MDKIVTYKDDSGEWRWRRVAGNNEIVATSGEGYNNLSDCVKEAIKVNGMDVEYLPPEVPE